MTACLPSRLSTYRCNVVNMFFYVATPDLPAARLPRKKHFISVNGLFYGYSRCRGYLLWGTELRFIGSFQTTTPCSATRATAPSVPPRKNIRHLCQTMTVSVTTTWNLMLAILSSLQVSRNFFRSFDLLYWVESREKINI